MLDKKFDLASVAFFAAILPARHQLLDQRAEVGPVLDRHDGGNASTLDDVLGADSDARRLATRLV